MEVTNGNSLKVNGGSVNDRCLVNVCGGVNNDDNDTCIDNIHFEFSIASGYKKKPTGCTIEHIDCAQSSSLGYKN